MKKPTVLIDLGKLKNLYTGLGQVSLNFGKTIQQQNTSLDCHFLIPKGFEKDFKPYEKLSLKRRYLPSFCKKYNLWHAIHQDSAYFPNKNTPYILTIHDLNFLGEKNPKKSDFRLKRLQRKVNRAAAITMISKYTERVVRENLDLPNVPVKVIYNGVEDICNAPRTPLKINLTKPFLFNIGVVKAKKNLAVLLPLMELLTNYQLVIAGDDSDDFGQYLHNEVKKRKLQDRVFILGKISAEERNWCYANCEAFVFPSKYEGFGLPVIEAMQFGKPVFLSTWSSLPEVGGKVAYYWDSFKANNMRIRFLQGIEAFYQSSTFAEKVIAHAQQFTWEQNVKAYLELYGQLIMDN